MDPLVQYIKYFWEVREGGYNKYRRGGSNKEGFSG
jgi:hypothetical protein